MLVGETTHAQNPPPTRNTYTQLLKKTLAKDADVSSKSKTRTCVETCARGAGTHGGVLNVHTGTF